MRAVSMQCMIRRSENSAELLERGLTGEQLSEARHEWPESLVTHVGNSAVPIGTLVEERHRPVLHRIRLQSPVETAGFACSAEEREQRLSDSGDEEQAVATLRRADVRGREAHAEVGCP